VPTSTDLVKDGATAIEALGDSIDASLLDLKGGTTGQVLSKNSNTDMDFTWVTDAAGDITGVTAGTGLTGGGTSGSVSLAFDVANYGGGQYAAGKNKIINGDFGIAQRGTSITMGQNGYNLDRWTASVATAFPTGTISQQVMTPGNTITGYEFANFARINPTVANGCTSWQWTQKIEDVRTYANQAITVSFWAKADASCTATIDILQNFGSGGSATVTGMSAQNIALTTAWTRFSFTATMPSISGKTIGTGSSLDVRFSMPLAAGVLRLGTYDFVGVQLEAGSTATPFQTASGTIQGELAMCQRYYYRTSPNASGAPVTNTGGIITTTIAQVYVPMPVTMRVNVAAIDYSAIDWYNFGNNTTYNSGTYTLTAATPNYASVRYTHGSAIFTAGQVGAFVSNGSSAYLGFTAEL
jgi:hypothetical protein